MIRRTLQFIAAVLLAWIIGTLLHCWQLLRKGVVVYTRSTS